MPTDLTGLDQIPDPIVTPDDVRRVRAYIARHSPDLLHVIFPTEQPRTGHMNGTRDRRRAIARNHQPKGAPPDA